MLAKLLKYDFRSLRRFGLPILLAILITTVLGAMNIAFFIFNIKFATAELPFFTMITTAASGTMLFFLAMVLAAAISGVQILIYVDFYKSLVSDEGYLTFTLPVKAGDILRSKLINGILWSLIVGAAALLSFGIIVAVGIVSTAGWQALVDILTIPPIPIDVIGQVVLLLLSSLLLSAISAVNGLLLYFMAIFFASVIARKHKVLVAIGCVYGVNMIYSIVGSIASPFITLFLTPVTMASNALLIINVAILIGCILLTGLNVLFFYLTQYMMERKLNLA